MDEPTRATARLSAAARPRRGEGSTSQGHPRTIFRRALERGNLLVAEALELTLLIAQKEPHRHPRVAARWLLRYLEESDEVTIREAAMAASCLAALGNDEEAPRTLRAMAERATRRARGVA